MNASLRDAVEKAIASGSGTHSAIAKLEGASGGCISQAQTIILDDGRRFFLKWNPAPLPEMFERECDGLRALEAVSVIRVPRSVAVGGEAGTDVAPFIVMECIEIGAAGPSFFEEFGRAFAEFHRRGAGQRFGFDTDNYIGATPQPNTWCSDWCTFWRDHRLGFQLQLLARQGVHDAELQTLGERLLGRLDDYLRQPDEAPCLLHGDLWGGNYLVDADGAPVLIDPAAYFGRREADLAMTQLFGGFQPRFYSAYEETWPLAPGSRERLEVYKLYHLLNHLNLFGASYRDQCVTTLKRLT